MVMLMFTGLVIAVCAGIGILVGIMRRLPGYRDEETGEVHRPHGAGRYSYRIVRLVITLLLMETAVVLVFTPVMVIHRYFPNFENFIMFSLVETFLILLLVAFFIWYVRKRGVLDYVYAPPPQPPGQDDIQPTPDKGVPDEYRTMDGDGTP